jgi:hypothetical protein
MKPITSLKIVDRIYGSWKLKLMLPSGKTILINVDQFDYENTLCYEGDEQ